MKSTSYIIIGIPVAVLVAVIGCMIFVRAGRVPAQHELTFGGDVGVREIASAPVDSLSLRELKFDSGEYYSLDWLNVEISVDPTVGKPVVEAPGQLLDILEATPGEGGALTLCVDLNKTGLSEREVRNLNKVEFSGPITIVLPQAPSVVSVDEGKVDVTLYNMEADWLKFISQEGTGLNLRNVEIGYLTMRVWGDEHSGSTIWDNSSIGTLRLQMVPYAYVSIEADQPSTADRVIIASLPSKRDGRETPRLNLPGLKIRQFDNRSIVGLTVSYSAPFSATFAEN